MKRDREQLREEDEEADSVALGSDLQEIAEHRVVMIVQEISHKKANLVSFHKDFRTVPFEGRAESLLSIDTKQGVKIPKVPAEAFKLFQSIAAGLASKRRFRKNWNMAELSLLFWLLLQMRLLRGREVTELVPEEWEEVGGMIPGRDGQKCMFKWLTFRKFQLSSFPWTECEDATLKRLMSIEGRVNWLEVSQTVYLENTSPTRAYRSGKQCRERWTSHLEPGLKKGCWQPEQDLQIMELFKRIGKKWFQMSKIIPNRSENSIKNRFSLLVKKYERKEDEDEDKVVKRIVLDIHKKMTKGRRAAPHKTQFIRPSEYEGENELEVVEQHESLQKADSLIRDLRDSQLWKGDGQPARFGTLSEQFNSLELLCEGVASISLQSLQEVKVQKLDLLEVSSLSESVMECVLDMDSLVIYHSYFRTQNQRTNSISSVLSNMHEEQRRHSKRSETVPFPRLLIYPSKRQTLFSQVERRNSILSQRIGQRVSQAFIEENSPSTKLDD